MDFDTEKYPHWRNLLDLDGNETEELMELTGMQKALDQPTVIAGHVLTAIDADSESPEGP